MADRFNASQKNVIDRDARNMYAAGYPLSTELNDLWAEIDTGNIGITADAADVDAICSGGGVLGHDADTTSGLSVGFFGGRALFGQAIVAVAAGTVTLSASGVNYVELDSEGVVSSHTSPASFTPGRVPLYKVTTGSASISVIENARVLLVGFADHGIVGAWISDAVRTHGVQLQLGGVSATSAWAIISPSHAGTLASATITAKATLSASDTDYWTFTMVNKGPGGSGTTAMLAETDANTTKVTGGSGITAFVARSLSLHASPANLAHAAGDVLVFTATKSGSAAAIDGAAIQLNFASEL